MDAPSLISSFYKARWHKNYYSGNQGHRARLVNTQAEESCFHGGFSLLPTYLHSITTDNNKPNKMALFDMITIELSRNKLKGDSTIMRPGFQAVYANNSNPPTKQRGRIGFFQE
jgi:hypothetical protein